MKLSVAIETYYKSPIANGDDYVFSEQGGSIGRESNNQLILNDSEKFVSSQHALIYFNHPNFYIEDTSTNGLYLNSKLLGEGNTAQLKHGDHLKMGEYELSVTYLDQAVQSPNPIHPSDPDPFGTDVFPPSDDLISNHDSTDDDPFKEFETIGSNPVAELIESRAETSTPWESDSPFDDFFEKPANTGTPSNHVSPLDEPITPPGGSPETINANDTDDGTEALDFPPDWFSKDISSTPQIQTQQTKNIETPEQPSVSSVDISSEPNPIKKNESTSKTSGSDQKGTDEYLRKFIKGIELDSSQFNHSVGSDSFYVIGKTLRTTVEGTMELIANRANIKNAMRLDVTTIKSKNNNPIKFSVNTDEALSRLLMPQSAGYMPPVTAIEEIFDDLKAHQIAVLAGMQLALKSILKRFDPNLLEKRLEKQSPISSKIPIHRQARLWSLFEDLYEEIETEATDDFNRLFGNEFAKAYEEQIEEIRRKRGQDRVR